MSTWNEYGLIIAPVHGVFKSGHAAFEPAACSRNIQYKAIFSNVHHKQAGI